MIEFCDRNKINFNMETFLFIISLLISIISAIPIARNITDVDIILDQDFHHNFECNQEEPSKEKPHSIINDLKGLLQSILMDTSQSDKDNKAKCRNTTLGALDGIVVHEFENSHQLLQSGGIIDVTRRPSIPRCKGILKIIVENRLLGGSDTSVVTNLNLTGWRYGNLLKPLGRKNNILRNVIKIQTEGNCCWKIFSKPRYRGLTQFVNPGFDESPRHRIKSAKKMDCHEKD